MVRPAREGLVPPAGVGPAISWVKARRVAVPPRRQGWRVGCVAGTARTCALLLRRRPLCPLSYGGVSGRVGAAGASRTRTGPFRGRLLSPLSYDGKAGKVHRRDGLASCRPVPPPPGGLVGSVCGEPSLGVEPSPRPYRGRAQPLSYKGVGLAGTTRTCYLRLRRAALCPDELRRDGHACQEAGDAPKRRRQGSNLEHPAS